MIQNFATLGVLYTHRFVHFYRTIKSGARRYGGLFAKSILSDICRQNMNRCPRATDARELVGAIVDPTLSFCRESLRGCFSYSDVFLLVVALDVASDDKRRPLLQTHISMLRKLAR